MDETVARLNAGCGDSLSTAHLTPVAFAMRALAVVSRRARPDGFVEFRERTSDHLKLATSAV